MGRLPQTRTQTKNMSAAFVTAPSTQSMPFANTKKTPIISICVLCGDEFTSENSITCHVRDWRHAKIQLKEMFMQFLLFFKKKPESFNRFRSLRKGRYSTA